MLPRPQQLAFIAGIVPAARASQAKWGVPASITIAQAIQESGWGRSDLAVKCHNYFGVKAIQGEAYEQFPTHEVVKGRTVRELASFAFYSSPIASFDAHGKLLATLKRYRPAMAAADDPLAFAIQIQACGYCTDPKYPSELASLIKQFDLTQYDVEPKPALAQPDGDPTPLKKEANA